MIKFIPVPISQHNIILGVDFNTKFAAEMHSYYAPFVAKNRDIQVAKETWEYAVADSIIGANWCGAGHNVVDVKTPIADIDVKGISNNDMEKYKLTTEASFLQNNKQENDRFVNLFENKDYSALKEMFVDPLTIKIKGTNNLHLLGIIREKDKRFMLPSARHMIHQPSGGARGQATDMLIQVEEILAMKKNLTEIYVKHNSAGKSFEQLTQDMERDNFMSAQQALEYGLIDKIIEKRE